MAFIDDSVVKGFEKAPGEKLPVIITFSGSQKNLVNKLTKLKISYKSSESAVFGIINSDISKEQLSQLQTQPEIESIEMDSEARALD